MEVSALEKVINSIFIPKFPWVEDYRIKKSQKEGYKKFYIEFKISEDASDLDEEAGFHFMHKLFKILGPTNNEFLEVEFYFSENYDY